jgi:hypothetical protein
LTCMGFTQAAFAPSTAQAAPAPTSSSPCTTYVGIKRVTTSSGRILFSWENQLKDCTTPQGRTTIDHRSSARITPLGRADGFDYKGTRITDRLVRRGELDVTFLGDFTKDGKPYPEIMEMMPAQ